ncbi:MAG: endolytic transglycosylase MltG [Candidatus Doudnabacteria bacterium]|nr:endolytic transglycosylase MltG [Candidatus Doudnabacteria bacterium]
MAQKQKTSISKLKLFGGCLAILVVGGLLLGGGAYLWWQENIVTPNSTDSTKITIQVKEGDTLVSIAEELNKQGALKSVDAFKLYLRLYPLASTTVQQGRYEIPKNLTIAQLLETLAAGPVIKTVQVTIIEGLRFDEVVESIVSAYAEASEPFDRNRYLEIVQNPDAVSFSAENAAFLDQVKPAGKNLEGFLFPDTYNVAVDAGALDLIELQLTTLRQKLQSAGLNLSDAGRLANYYEVINLASIVQREAKRYEDMQMVSDVFLKRLEQDWPLDADASLLYPLKRWTPPLTRDELARDTAYNTYKRLGLPPTPICNPGLDAIKSVINFTANPYFYYITDKNGIKRFAKTLVEHQQNIDTYGLAF